MPQAQMSTAARGSRESEEEHTETGTECTRDIIQKERRVVEECRRDSSEHEKCGQAMQRGSEVVPVVCCKDDMSTSGGR